MSTHTPLRYLNEPWDWKDHIRGTSILSDLTIHCTPQSVIIRRVSDATSLTIPHSYGAGSAIRTPPSFNLSANVNSKSPWIHISPFALWYFLPRLFGMGQ